ncbi:hypothetical protein H5T87_03470 [bacterium]|nr:hypothetical protein [bacterium]
MPDAPPSRRKPRAAAMILYNLAITFHLLVWSSPLFRYWGEDSSLPLSLNLHFAPLRWEDRGTFSYSFLGDSGLPLAR